jgi:hypothetical protein
LAGHGFISSRSFPHIFAVLSSYYIMRPIRDQMGVAGGVNNLQWLFMGTLGGMLLLSVPFGFPIGTLPRTRFIPITYRFFAAVILLFALALHWADTAQTVWVGRIFFGALRANDLPPDRVGHAAGGGRFQRPAVVAAIR